MTAAVDALAGCDAQAHPAGDPSADIGPLWQLIERLHGVYFRRLAAAESDGRWAADGHAATFPSWVAGATGQPHGTAAGAVRTARLLDGHLPTVRSALIEGRTGLDAVRIITKIGSSTPVRKAALTEADGLFADLATRFPAGELATLVRRWADLVDVDGVLRDADALHRNRYLMVSTNLDGSVSLDARLDPESGALVRTWLDAATGPATWTSADSPPPDTGGPPDPGGRRSMPQRRADALVALAKQALDGGQLPAIGGLRPHLLVTATESVLRQAVRSSGCGSLAGPGPNVDVGRYPSPDQHPGPGLAPDPHLDADPRPDPHPDPHPEFDRDRLPGADAGRRAVREPHPVTAAMLLSPEAAPAVLHPRNPLTGADLARLACDAVVTAALLDGSGEPLRLGRATRTISPALRKALILRDGGCAYPGCDRPWTWTDAHHIHHWADGGRTDLENLVLLCQHHHRTVHRHRLRPRRLGPDEPVPGGPALRSAAHRHGRTAGGRWNFLPVDRSPG